jgi:PKD repeat protein/subtilisin-like proprotein convertase family protein
MKSIWRVLVGTLALVLVGLGLLWTISYQPPQAGSASARLAGGVAQLGSSETPPFTQTVSGPYAPTISIAVRDLPVKPDLPTLDREPAQRDNRGFVGPDIQMPPHGNVLAELQANALEPIPDDFTTPILNFAGVQDNSSPPDDTGDVGPNHFLQGDNGPNGSRVTVFDKTGAQLAQFDMEDLATNAPCTSGYCDPVIQYDELADRWMIAEFDSSANTLCVYISTTPDPLGTWYAYAFDPPGGMQDYPKYAVWPDGYYVGVNNGGTVIALERNDMLNGVPASMQTFNIGLLPGFGFQLTVPATLEGTAPPAGAPVYFLRPRDTEIHGGTCTNCDLMELWGLHVDWTTPANSALTPLTGAQLTDWDQTLCGTGSDWSCMSQPGTAQKLDPIREPAHYPPQYRNFGTHETLVGCFAEDVDGLDRAATHWFELRRTPPGSGDWVNYQEGVIGDGVNDIHRSVCSAAMDSAGNIAVGYTRTGGSAPYYPSIYYAGRRASDPLGTMPYYDIMIWDATNSKTNNERWGDYSGIGVDPVDGCTFWYTTEYGGNGQTRIAAFKFDECGTPDFTLGAAPHSLDVCAPEDAVYTVNIGSVSEYSSTVTLVSTGEPAGTTAAFVPNPVMPPGTSLLTIGDTGNAAPGSYTIVITGTAEGSAGHQDSVTLNLFDAAPEVPALLLPVDGSLDNLPRPTYDWSDVAGASSYTIQIASDPDFLDIVDQASGLTASTYTPAGYLGNDSVYYWRVYADNACGSTLSVVNAFRTAFSSCITFISTDVPKPINDNAWTTSVLNIPDSFQVTDVDVILDSVTHTYDGDLDIYIRHPDNTEVELSTDNGGSGENYIDTRFDDEAATPITSGSAPFTGSFRPEGTLGTLDGKTANGTWTLRIYDDAGQDTGTLDNWSLVLCGAGGGLGSDYSDLDYSYGVAWHTGDGALRLGTAWTLDSAFAPPGFDDLSDDGISFPSGFDPGQTNTVRVNVQGTPVNGRWLQLWFDFNGDGIFGDLAEGELAYNGALVSGDNDIPVDAPGIVVTPLYFRARLYDSAGSRLRDANSWGGADGGEVEDGQTDIEYNAGLILTPPYADQSGEPGTTVTYYLTATNTGPNTDSYYVAVSGNGWPTDAPLVVGPVVAGESANFDVTVDIPLEANDGDSDQVSIILMSQNDPNVNDVSVLTTTAVVGCIDLTGITIAGPSSGEPGVYTFTTTYEPISATLPIVYLWDNGDTTADSVRTLGEGNYTLVVTATNCSAAQVTGTHDIEIGVPPEVTFVSNTPVSLGEVAVFTPTVTGTAPFEYLWDFGDGVTSTLESPTHLYAADGTYAVTLTVTSAWGTDSFTAQFEVVGVPPEATFVSNTPVTLGEVAVFTPTVTGTAPFEYLWDFGDGVTSTLEAPTHLYAAAGTYTVTLTVTSAWGTDSFTAQFVVIPVVPSTFFTYLSLLVK